MTGFAWPGILGRLPFNLLPKNQLHLHAERLPVLGGGDARLVLQTAGGIRVRRLSAVRHAAPGLPAGRNGADGAVLADLRRRPPPLPDVHDCDDGAEPGDGRGQHGGGRIAGRGLPALRRHRPPGLAAHGARGGDEPGRRAD